VPAARASVSVSPPAEASLQSVATSATRADAVDDATARRYPAGAAESLCGAAAGDGTGSVGRAELTRGAALCTQRGVRCRFEREMRGLAGRSIREGCGAALGGGKELGNLLRWRREEMAEVWSEVT
jgi:hypothetical protein